MEPITLSSRRSRFKISVEVLTANSNGEQRSTRIMYACDLSWNSIKDTLSFLVAKGYVKEMYENQNRKRYSITGKGVDVIRYYSGLLDLVQVGIIEN